MQVETADVIDVMFQPMPSVIYLQNYQPHKTYEVPLLLRNLDVVSVVDLVFIEGWTRDGFSHHMKCFSVSEKGQ